ncbi:MAG TPA: alpha/beta fold hydrolase [Chloroflexota bacterium]|nr:alpha/beta fold hydrolase [Chloroflexota bacterium]
MTQVGVRDETIDVAGRATRLLAAGDGPPLVWLHDTLGNRWSAGHSRLSESYQVIAPSLPGVEDSATLDGIDGPEDVVFWLGDFLRAAGVERPVLLGCGLGGWMAAEFAVRNPHLVGRLVLVNAYGLRVPGALAEDEFALTPPMLRPLLFAEPEGELAMAVLPNAEPAERLEQTLHARVAAARLAWQFPYSRKLAGRLWRATVPALVVWGERDRLLPVAHAEAYAAGLPSAHLVVLSGVGHYPYLEAPEAFADAISW